MSRPVWRFESELRTSLKPVIGALVVFGIVSALIGDTWSDPDQRSSILFFAMLLYILSAIVWLLDRWRSLAGRWFMVVALVATVQLGNSWLDLPGFMAFWGIPTALAAVLIGLPAAILTAVGESSLLLLFAMSAVSGTDGISVNVITMLVAVWAMLGIMYVNYRPIRQLSNWLWEYFHRANSALEEAQNRKAELAQALEDLAHANRQLALINERLVAMRLIAEEAQKTKAAFVAKVSHEFRTPLNMIIGLIDLLTETPEVYGQELPSALFEDLEIVHRNCEHLAGMVNDVLDLSQAEAGRLTLNRERVDLPGIIKDAVTVVRPLLDKKHLDLEVIVPYDLPRTYCDRTRIRQVILNLLSNAARFTEKGKIAIRAVVQDQHTIVVSVIDTGPGIPLQDADTIFEPFCQGSRHPWRDKGGSGLGLSISKQFVELHGGRIWLKSEPGIGTTFSFSLPISEPIAHIAKPGHWIREDWVWVQRRSKFSFPESHYRPRVVVCDETKGLSPTLGRYSDEIEFVPARDLDQLIYEVRQCPVHAVILNAASFDDLWPLADGIQAEVPDTPIIGCSVSSQLEHALRAGAANYLIKPVRRTDLERALQQVSGPIKRVLAVDDDRDVLQLWTRMLYACDKEVNVVTASNGAEALNELRRSPPDLVLLDILMPDMDGWQILDLVKQNEATRDIPVVLISAQDPAEHPAKSKALLATMGEELLPNQIVRCSLAISRLLLECDQRPVPVPAGTDVAAQASAGREQHHRPALVPVP